MFSFLCFASSPLSLKFFSFAFLLQHNNSIRFERQRPKIMAVGSSGDGNGSRLFLAETGEHERSWRLNFDGFRRVELLEEKPPRLLHRYLSTLVKDVVAEYYQQQVEMLDGFGEMDTLTDRGFLPQMSKEERENIGRSETLAIRISNAANVVLFVGKVYASVRSGSWRL